VCKLMCLLFGSMDWNIGVIALRSDSTVFIIERSIKMKILCKRPRKEM
jgi:hypothetical protein